MSRRLLSFLVLLLCSVVLLGCPSSETGSADGSESGQAPPRSPVAALQAGDADLSGYAKADRKREFVFPADHGPHPDFQTEWWYFTGHLEDVSTGESFGFQWTVFRRALAPPSSASDTTERASAWATRQLYMGHFALSDLDGGRFHSAERFSRGAVGLAGARSEPFRVWLEDWEASSRDEASTWPLVLRASQEGATIDLVLEPETPLVLQGDGGLSWKSSGGASYYYSYTRLAARGTVRADGVEHTVTGSAWLDREWSTSVLAEDQAGWDWFSLQLDDGRDVMVYRLRGRSGGDAGESYGVVVDSTGEADRFGGQGFDLEVTDRWTSPRTGAEYPAGWRLRIPDHGLDLEIAPSLADQELDVSFPYWEGAVRVSGGDEPGLGGRGYVELVGYGSE